MRWMLVVAVIAGCGSGELPRPRLTDAGGVDAASGPSVDAYACIHVIFDAGVFGEPCSPGECHDGLGWCVEGACRPQCVQPHACLACEGETERFTRDGACYCAPGA